MNFQELAKRMIDAADEVSASIIAYEALVRKDADADDEKRRAIAREYVRVREEIPKATVGYVEAIVDERTSDVQKAARLADGLKRAGGMRVEGARTILSSLQSLARASTAEAELAKWGPRETDAA